MAKLSNYPGDSLAQWISYRVKLTRLNSGKTSSNGLSSGKKRLASALPGGCRKIVEMASTLPSHFFPIFGLRCASFVHLTGRWEISTCWVKSWSGKVNFAVRYPRRGVLVSDISSFVHDFWLFNPCLTSLRVWAPMNHIRIRNQVHELSKCIFRLSERLHHLKFSDYLLVTLHFPLDW